MPISPGAKGSYARLATNWVEPTFMLTLDETSHGRKIEAVAGEELEISLSENPTTGYRWEMERPTEPVCIPVSDAFEAGQGAAGRSGTHRWRFKASGKGTAILQFKYRRHWESADQAARTFCVEISVH